MTNFNAIEILQVHLRIPDLNPITTTPIAIPKKPSMV